MCFLEMTAHSHAVGAADDDVWMQRRLAVSPKGDVAKERNDLDLLGDGNLSVAFRLPVEEPEHCITARADAGELGGRNAALAGKALNAANRLIALVPEQEGYGSPFRATARPPRCNVAGRASRRSLSNTVVIVNLPSVGRITPPVRVAGRI